MKVPNNLYLQIEKSLQEIFFEGKHADKAIEYQLKSQKKWGSRDRRYFAESVYEIVRWWRKFAMLANVPHPESADVARIVHMYFTLDTPEMQKRLKELNLAAEPAVRFSYSDEMWQVGEKELGARWLAIAESLNQASTVDLRANTLRTNPEKLKQRLQQEGINSKLIDQGVTLIERKNVFVTKAFQEGQFEVQDRASQLVAPFLRVEPGMRVVDACAGAGGKSLHLATLMKNKGKVLSLDIHERKLEELKKRAARNRIDCIETRWIDSQKVIKRLQGTADRLLLDVPCSGMGVLRRNPDSKWKFKRERLAELQEIQRNILKNYSSILKPTGLMVYSTCSVLPSENEQQVEHFLAATEGKWKLIEQVRIDPDQGRGDGFFMALLAPTQ